MYYVLEKGLVVKSYSYIQIVLTFKKIQNSESGIENRLRSLYRLYLFIKERGRIELMVS